MSKKIVAMLMAVAMAFSLLPVTAFATDGPSATTTGDVVYGHYENGENGAWTEGAPTRTDGLDNTVTVNKTAEKVDGQDNQYDVTLKVEMKHKTTEVPPGAAATVLVIDTSGSMKKDTKCNKKEHVHDSNCYTWEECTQENHPNHYWWDYWTKEYKHIWPTSCTWDRDGNRYVYQRLICDKEEHRHGRNCETTSRIAAAKVAARNFLNSYRGGTVSEDGTWTHSATPLERYVSIVSFNKYVSKNDWVDVSTQDGYDAAIASINALSADGGTNLDAGLRMANAQLNNGTVQGMPANVVVLTDGKPTYHLKKAENQNKNSDVEIEGVKYSVKGKGNETLSATYDQTVKTAAMLQQAASVYTVCFGASNERLEAEDKPTVSEFLKTNIATQQAEGQTYAYDANDTTDLYKAFAAISSSVVSGLKTGTVTDALPNGVSCVTNGTFDENGNLTWRLDPEKATKSEPDSNDFITYTYEKKYTVEINPEAEGLNVENGYVPLNRPTKLTVQHNDSPVKIPFPIPAGKVTYSLTDFEKALVTNQNKPDGLMIPEGVTIPATVPVVISDEGVTLLYKITVKGDKGAKFIVRDDGATLVSPKDDSITFNQEGSTFSGTVGTTGETVFYVSKYFTQDNIETSGDTKSVSNTATIVPGDNAKGPEDNEKTKTVTTTVTEATPQTYTVTYQWAEGEKPSDADTLLPQGGTFTVGTGYTVVAAPMSTVTKNEAGENGKWTCAWDQNGDVGSAAQAGKNIVITGTWTFKETEPPTPPAPTDPVEWYVSRSKTATKLDTNTWTSNVTLSLPSAEEKLASDVVFVLDKSTSAALEEQALAMLTQLKAQAESTKATVKVGVVIFNKEANVTQLTDLATGYNTIEQAIKQDLQSGTNTHAGLLAGKQMLDNDNEVSANRKYLIFVSDGISYMYDSDGKVVPYYWISDNSPYTSYDPYSWSFKYEDNNPPENWSEWVKQIGEIIETEDVTPILYANHKEALDNKTLDISQYTNVTDFDTNQYTTCVDRALYYTYQTYTAAKNEGYNCYAVVNRSSASTTYPWGPAFMNYLAGGETVSFDKIQNDILYAVSAGSTVTDTIGEKFTFGGVDSFTLKVGEEEIKGAKDASDENTMNFGAKKSDGNYPYTVTYTPDTKTFKWTINENVSNFAPVKLTYTVKLTKPETAAGTYGVEDLNGDGIVDGTESTTNTTVVAADALYTNESATMVPKDSDENTGEELTFPKPSVSYTVSSGNSGSHSGGSRPSLNTKDHYGYIIGYPVDYYTGEATTDQTKKPVRPEGKITRAEVATIYFRMLTDESRTKFWSQSSGYSDVKTGDWFNNAVSTLSKAGIIAGYEDGSFRPNGYITRAEFATIAARFFDVTYNGKDLFPDISGHWAKDYINQAANKGFVNGYEDGTFKPDRNITRAEAVTLVNRTLDRHPDKNHFTKDMLVWPDNMDQTKWYYADMQEATNSHTYQMKENSDKTKYENWTKTLPIRNWEALEKAWSNANSSQGNGNVV